MRQVLVPTAIPERMTLYEALAWVAFNFYSTVEYPDGDIERRLSDDGSDVVDFESDFNPQVFFTKELCEKYGFPENAAFKDWKCGKKPPHDITSLVNGLKISESKEMLARAEKEQIEYQEYLQLQTLFEKMTSWGLEIM